MWRSLPRTVQSCYKLKCSSFHATSLQCARVLIAEPVHESVSTILQSRGHEILKDYPTDLAVADAIVIRSGIIMTKKEMKEGSHLKIIARAGTGTDNIDVGYATQTGVLVMNTPGANTISTAEYTIALLLGLSRQIPMAHKSVLNGKWERNEWREMDGLQGTTIGILGLGQVGREVATRCIALGMKVVAFDALISSSTAASYGITSVSIDTLLATSDFLSFHLPLHTTTTKWFNADRIALCKPGVQIINTSRAELWDYTEILKALESGQVRQVALDFTKAPMDVEKEIWDKLIKHPQVLSTPHLGSMTVDAQKRVGTQLGHQLAEALEARAFTGVVNAPHLDLVHQHGLIPYLSLAEKLGSLLAQLLDSNDKLSRMVVSVHGDAVSSPETSEAIVQAALKGLLCRMIEEDVHFSSARQVADSMGLRVEEHRHQYVHESATYSNQISIAFELESGKDFTVAGTVFGNNELRLTTFDDLKMDVVPSGNLLVFHNKDQPGVLRSLTAALSAHNINIASFGVGRNENGTSKDASKTMGILTLDEPLSLCILDELKLLPNIENLRQVQLLDMPFVRGLETFLKQPNFNTKNEESVLIKTQSMHNPMPTARPKNPQFGSGPCKKRPGYSLSNLAAPELFGRSHRSVLGKSRLKQAVVETKHVLNLPSDYHVAIVPGSDTGAFEMAMWNLLGPRPVDVCHWESFGKGWHTDLTTQLGLDVHEHTADYGQLPDLEKTNAQEHDVVLTWNGTTSGVKVPHGDWIPEEREGLILNDATSAAFAMDIPWNKIDVGTFSWQKVLGGEGAHGMMIMGPRAIERLETFTPKDRPMPKVFRMKNTSGKVLMGLFEGETINTPSMLCVEDYLDALRWTNRMGGVPGLMERSHANLSVLESFVDAHHWIHFLAQDKTIRSNTSVCLTLDLEDSQLKHFRDLLERQEVAYDIGSYKDAPNGLRIWCGATVEVDDLQALCPWLKWAYHYVKQHPALE